MCRLVHSEVGPGSSVLAGFGFSVSGLEFRVRIPVPISVSCLGLELREVGAGRCRKMGKRIHVPVAAMLPARMPADYSFVRHVNFSRRQMFVSAAAR